MLVPGLGFADVIVKAEQDKQAVIGAATVKWRAANPGRDPDLWNDIMPILYVD